MVRLRTGTIRTALWRLAGLVATLVVTSLLLGLLLGDGSPLSAAAAMLTLNFGTSASMDAAVGELIAERLTVTLPLAAFAAVLAVMIGLPCGFAARRTGTPRSAGLTMIARVLLALPSFWLGMMLIVVFAGVLKWVTPGGFVPWERSFGGALASLTLPSLALALPFAAMLVRATARWASGTDASPVIFAARLNGLTARTAMFRHGWLPAVAPLSRFLGARFGLLLSGAMVVESVFYLPGLGRLLFGAATAGDAALVQGTLFVMIVIAALVRLGAELMALLMSPKQPDGLPA